jgi:putative ABC transport system permease protein
MRDRVWQIVEQRLRSVVPPAHAASTIGDLAEDYARLRATQGIIRSRLWLLREAGSLARAYRAADGSRRRFPIADDCYHAWRRLAARPASALLGAGLLALGIGLATAMFSVVDSLLLTPAPFREADRLVQQGFWRPEPAVMDAWRTSAMFDDVQAARLIPFQYDEGGARGWVGAYVTPGVFDMLGVRPLRGRAFGPESARPGSENEVVLSEVIWRSAFGGDADLLGRHIRVNGSALAVVGVMPASFRFPRPDTMLWRPFDPSASDSGATVVYGRLKPGVPRANADAMAAIAARQLARLPASYRGTPPVQRVGDVDLGGFTRRALWLLLGGVALVFVVLCANVSSLLLAQLSGRRREFGLCGALGASRARLMRQAAVEHMLIGALGAAAGVALAWGLTSIVPEFFLGRTLNVVNVDLRALLIACALGVASVLLAGLVPAWLGTHADPSDALRGSRQVATETRAATIATRGLLGAEIALACALLVGSTLLVRSFTNLVQADRGLSIDGVTQVRVSGFRSAYSSVEAIALAVTSVSARFAAAAGVEGAAVSQEIPPISGPRGGRVLLDDLTVASDAYRVSASFFHIYRIPILRGRTFEPGDTPLDVVVGERLARLLWPGQDPVGQTYKLGSYRDPRRVIGVAGEIRLPTVDADRDLPEFYQPLDKDVGTIYVSLRCRGACPDDAAIRSIVGAVHPALNARIVSPSEIEYLNHLRLPRALAEVGVLFAIVAVITAAGGLFSVMTHAVGLRRREFGIRTALGASPAQMRALVFRDASTITAIGLASGALGGWMVAHSLTAFHYGVSPFDPVTWLAVMCTIAATSLAAVWRPARQAVRVDPVALLREE